MFRSRALLKRPSAPRRVASTTATTTARAFSSADRFQRTDTFLHRHLGVNDHDRALMLEKVGFPTVEALIDATVPKEIRLAQPLQLPEPLTESEALAKLKGIAEKNKTLKSFIGMGYYDTLTPFPIQRNILENPGWYTSYTPYQAEVSQGRLEMLLNFQTMVMDLTGMDFSNASLLDEATAAAEAMSLSHGSANGKRNSYFVSADCHPQTIGVMKTRADNVGINLVVGNPLTDLKLGSDAAKEFSGVLIQYPNTFGDIHDYRDFVSSAHESGLLVSVAADLLSLTQLTPPAEIGADIAIGSAQRFGVPMMFGGPHAAYMATTKKHHRKLPGRIIGVSKDSRGEKALRMAMQTREQHIRRDKATSNICTAQALLANMAAAYAIYHGPEGIGRIAERANFYSATLAAGIEKYTKASVRNQHFFDTLDIDVSETGLSAQEVLDRGVELGVNLRLIDATRVGVAMGESVTLDDVKHIVHALGGVALASVDELKELSDRAEEIQAKSIPASLKRQTPFLEHGIFHKYRSETELMRYLKHLEDKDLALNRSMISLGSCTMKLNSVSELVPVTWSEFMNVHPFVPDNQSEGYQEMIATLNATLSEITGFSAVSTQPNSGAQGEYAGLLVIRNYQRSIGQGHRNVCLIPVSAHGTNPASAVMAGMKVVVVKSDENGNIDRVDLEEKTKKHAHELSALMITYPSTFGVFEEGVKDMCKLIHDNGGQVYMDGANMNAQVALCNPGNIGADVCHLNLHKTFCIPHGGGGPGVGSIGVAKHLAPYLPGHAVAPVGGEGIETVKKTDSAVSAAPFGSAGILPISWMYIHMLGEAGLKQATSNAILNANYMAKSLEDHYNIVYRGKNGTCAHEFIIDIRPFKDAGIVEEDVAKRLQDFGFHSPTMSWPVGGTLMIEPTESESKAEMDRFCDAMKVIRQEIEDVRTGKIAVADSPLKHAPHTVDVVTAADWDRKYSRQQAAFPAAWQLGGKNKMYWPTVGRVDNVHGDRNLVCSCPPLSDYE
uniref:Glycine cleavage system P protein n=1 Tax=Globisporangium ultimum (strain ATCC 200006 / CBS 805.95 / DAOM BR144) TaxID=431595 RepID=K3W837_GLOUD